LDALYEDVEKFAKWVPKHIQKSFLVHIFTEGSCEDNSMVLADSFSRRRIRCNVAWPKKISKGEVFFIKSPSDHMKVPIEGPPPDPLAALLRSLRM
jgi:hypothetical protein